MIDELVLERLLDEIAQDIPVPEDGADRVLHGLQTAVPPSRRPSPRVTCSLLVAAAVAVVVGGIAVLAHGSSTNQAKRTAAASSPAATLAGNANGFGANGAAGNPGPKGEHGLKGAAGPTGAQGARVLRARARPG